MDDTLIDNINKLVKPNDTLWFLGDFCFGPREPKRFLRVAKDYRNRINCNNIIWIHGNHDPNPTSARQEEIDRYYDFRELFIEDYALLHTTIQYQKFTLCHYAMRTWHKSHHHSINCYGHSHGSLPDDPNALSLDCGVDCHAYKPLSLEQVKEIMSKKTYKPIDHHGQE